MEERACRFSFVSIQELDGGCGRRWSCCLPPTSGFAGGTRVRRRDGYLNWARHHLQSYTVHALLLMAGPALDLRFKRQVGSCVAEHDGICLKNPSLLQPTFIPSPFPPKHHPHQTFLPVARSIVSCYLSIRNHVWRRVSSIFLPSLSPCVRLRACIGLPLTPITPPSSMLLFVRPAQPPPLLRPPPCFSRDLCMTKGLVGS